jgi:hypothetical protein
MVVSGVAMSMPVLMGVVVVRFVKLVRALSIGTI